MPRSALTALSAFALVLVLASGAALAETHTVDQVGITFVPDDITIEVGDTVEWIWSGGTHTVTSGAHPDSAGAGDLFDSPLSAAVQLFSFTFTEAGEVPYHCIPHAAFGMVGIVRVNPPTPVDESTAVSSFSRVKSLYR
jgi:plastocyanin